MRPPSPSPSVPKFIALVALAAAPLSFATAAQAERQFRPAVRAAPVVRTAPVMRAAPVQSAPRFIARPQGPPARVFVQPQGPANPNVEGGPVVQRQFRHRGPIQQGPAGVGPVNPGPGPIGVGPIKPGPGPIGIGPIKPGPGPIGVGPIKPGPGPIGVGPIKPGPVGFGQIKPGPGGPIATPLHPIVPGGAGGLSFKPKFPAVALHNQFFPLTKGQKFMHFGGFRRAFIPIGLLGVAFFAGSYWYPDGYVSIGAPYCSGITPDGCQLYWREVDFEDGGSAPQCVQYCPQAGPPPAQFAALPPPPDAPEEAGAGSCQVTIYADPNFSGLSAPTGDNQPSLADSGWQNAVSSIVIQAGTWDFFAGDEFAGDSMRLAAGAYSALPADWDKKINSFMCVQPGAGA